MSNIALSLRIHHPRIRIDAIANTIDLAPSAAWSAGDLRMTPKGQLLEGQRTSTYWTAKLTVDKNASIDANLDDTLRSLEKYASFFKEITATGGRVEIFIGWFVDGNDGFVLNTQLLQQFVLLDISISIDGYFEQGNKASSAVEA